MGAMASQITSLVIVYSTVHSGGDQTNIKAPRHWPLCGDFTGDRQAYFISRNLKVVNNLVSVNLINETITVNYAHVKYSFPRVSRAEAPDTRLKQPYVQMYFCV